MLTVYSTSSYDHKQKHVSLSKSVPPENQKKTMISKLPNPDPKHTPAKSIHNNLSPDNSVLLLRMDQSPQPHQSPSKSSIRIRGTMEACQATRMRVMHLTRRFLFPPSGRKGACTGIWPLCGRHARPTANALLGGIILRAAASTGSPELSRCSPCMSWYCMLSRVRSFLGLRGDRRMTFCLVFFCDRRGSGRIDGLVYNVIVVEL